MDWNPLPHGEFDKLEDNLWCVTGSLPNMGLPRRMTAIRLSDGRLVLYSVVALRAPHMDELQAWGRPAFIVVPNRYHRLDAPAFAERYPDATVLCPAAATGAVAQRVAVGGGLSDLPADDCLRVVELSGVKGGEGALLVTHADGGVSAIVNDLVFNIPHGPGFGGLVMKWIGSSGGPRVTGIGKLMMVADRATLADSLRGLADTPGLKRLVMSHGDIIDAGAPEVLRRVAADLAG